MRERPDNLSVCGLAWSRTVFTKRPSSQLAQQLETCPRQHILQA